MTTRRERRTAGRTARQRAAKELTSRKCAAHEHVEMRRTPDGATLMPARCASHHGKLVYRSRAAAMGGARAVFLETGVRHHCYPCPVAGMSVEAGGHWHLSSAVQYHHCPCGECAAFARWVRDAEEAR